MTKLEVLKEHLEGVLINGQKAIIITRFSRMAKILYKTFSETYGASIITGATNDRAAIIKEFESNSSKKILIGTEAIGQGLNLQMANISQIFNYYSENLLFIQFFWIPDLEPQSGMTGDPSIKTPQRMLGCYPTGCPVLGPQRGIIEQIL